MNRRPHRPARAASVLLSLLCVAGASAAEGGRCGVAETRTCRVAFGADRTVSVRAEEAALASVLDALAASGRVVFHISPGVSLGNVTVRFEGLPLDAAVERLLGGRSRVSASGTGPLEVYVLSSSGQAPAPRVVPDAPPPGFPAEFAAALRARGGPIDAADLRLKLEAMGLQDLAERFDDDTALGPERLAALREQLRERLRSLYGQVGSGSPPAAAADGYEASIEGRRE